MERINLQVTKGNVAKLVQQMPQLSIAPKKVVAPVESVNNSKAHNNGKDNANNTSNKGNNANNMANKANKKEKTVPSNKKPDSSGGLKPKSSSKQE